MKTLKVRLVGLLPFLFLFLGLLFSFYPTLFSVFSSMQSDPGDTLFNNYVLEHGYRWFTGRALHQSFWDAPFYFPEKNVIAYSDNLLGSAPIYWIFRGLNFLPDTAFQLWLIVLTILNFFSMQLLLRRGFNFNLPASCLGSFIFAFASPRALQIIHAQLHPHFYTPLFLFFLLKSFREAHSVKRSGWIGLSFLCCVAQIYSGYYLGWYLGITLIVAFILSFAFQETRRFITHFLISNWKSILVFSVISGCLLLPFVSHSLLAVKLVSGRTAIYEPKIQSWFYLGNDSWLYFWQEKIRLFKVISGIEQQIGIGLLTTVLIILGLYRNRKENWAKILSLTFLVQFVLMTSFYRNGCIWHKIYTYVPGAIGVRALSRLGIAALFFASIGIAAYFSKKVNYGWKVICLFAICVIEQGRFLPSFDKNVWRSEVSSVADKLDPYCTSFFYINYRYLREVYPHLTAMWATLRTEDIYPQGIPTLNGFSGSAPPVWSKLITLEISTPSAPSELDYRQWANDWLSFKGASVDSNCFLFLH